MNARFVVLAIVALGWLVASLLAFMFVATFTFGGVAVIGLALWFVCTRIELEKDATAGSAWTPELIARSKELQTTGPEEREKHRAEQNLALQSVRFFRHLGMALTAIGAGGFVWFQLLA